MHSMIFIGIGANLPSPQYGPPRDTCEAALAELEKRRVRVAARSQWYRSRPQPASGQPTSDQPWFVNGVARVETALGPVDLLALLHEVEAAFGRRRTVANAARVLDLDLLAHGETLSDGVEGPILPHPRLHERAFVLYPLRDIAPDWRHPRNGMAMAELVAALPAGHDCPIPA